MQAPPLAGHTLGNPDNSFAVAEWSDPGGPIGDRPRFIAPWHVHHNDDEVWYVLEGQLCVQSGSERVELTAGCGVLVPRGTPHTYWNPGQERVRYLLIMPPTIQRLIQGIHALTDRSPAALGAVFEECDSSLLPWPPNL
ncbi:cupin domain-containing protein [Acidobacteria bacterium AB60]|nr:cupin domain-containing protein [Acidobacteria bacterium AB60]